MSDGITDGYKEFNLDHIPSNREKLEFIQITIINMLISNRLTEDELNMMVQNCLKQYDIHKNRMIYQKVKGERNEN